MSLKTKKNRSQHLQDWEEEERVGHRTIISVSLSLNVFILRYQYGDEENSLFLTKRLLNEGLSISVDWLVNLGIMSILKALGLATVSLCVNFPSCPLLKSWWLQACALKMYSNRFIYWEKRFFSQVTLQLSFIHSWPHILLVNTGYIDASPYLCNLLSSNEGNLISIWMLSYRHIYQVQLQ